jgi:hypothetical protein
MPEAGVRAEQAALAERDDLGAAAAERPHDRGAAADVRPVAHHDALEMRPSTIEDPSVPALKFTKPSCITVVPGGQVRAEAHAVGVGDPHAGRDDVVRHPRELVHGRPRARARPCASAPR